MSQKCKHCGYEASDEEKYCPKCRNALDFAYQSETTQNAEKDLFALSKKAFIYSVLCIICAPLGAIAAAFFRGQLSYILFLPCCHGEPFLLSALSIYGNLQRWLKKDFLFQPFCCFYFPLLRYRLYGFLYGSI